MAKRSLIRRNDKRSKLSLSYSLKRKALLLTMKDLSSSFEDRLFAQLKLSNMPKDSSPVRYRNRCSLTGRPRGNLRKFALSRIIMRDLASFGQIPGVTKSSW